MLVVVVTIIISSLALPGVSLAAAEGECQSDCRNMVMPSAQCQLALFLSLSCATNLNAFKMPCKRDTLARSLDFFFLYTNLPHIHVANEVLELARG